MEMQRRRAATPDIAECRRVMLRMVEIVLTPRPRGPMSCPTAPLMESSAVGRD